MEVCDLVFPESALPQLLSFAALSDWPNGDDDRAFQVGEHRLRGNFYHTMGRKRLVVRRLPGNIPSVEDLGIPTSFAEMVIGAESGIALVCGPMGHGKSTTLASLLQRRLQSNDGHCVTIERPIEYLLKGKYPLQVSQREVGTCVESFALALRSALRQRASTIMVQEIIDADSALAAIHAANTGHFVLGTLHTGRVSLSIERLLQLIPPEKAHNVEAVLSEVLRGVMCQRLIKKQFNGVVAIHEVALKTPSISNHIRKRNFAAIQGELDTGSAHGLLSFHKSIDEKVNRGFIASSDRGRILAQL